MDVEITKINGDSFRLSKYDVTAQDFIVGSIPVTGLYGTVEGRAGTVDYGADFGQRPITVPFYMEANDFADYPLLRDELFALIISQDPFYIREMRRVTYQTGENQLVGGKRYKVRTVGGFDIEQQFRYGFGELEFETVDLPYAESVGTTQDIDKNGISADSGLWGFGMGLIADDESLKYSFTETSFRVYNAGNVPIHPFMQSLKISISDITGSGNSLELRNRTNGTLFKTNEKVSSSQTIILDGANVTSNGLQYLRKTNRGYIGLETGWNEFTVSGARSAEVALDFRFYYL